ncbi:putative repeat protein (TIGR04042 family) [Nakamurella sp. UYEF19]
MTFRVRWPDGSQTDCYSPSLVMHDHLSAGSSYPLPEFLRRTHTALGIASDRVRAKYGRPCAMAAAQLREIDLRAAPFASVGGEVEVLSMQPELPDSSGAI